MLLAHAAKGYTSIEASAADMVSIYAGFQEELYRRLDRYVRTGNTGFTGRSAVALREEIEAMFPELTAAWYETAKYPVSYLTQSFYQQALTDLAAGKSTGVTSGVNTARIKLALESSYNDIAGATKAMSESAVRNLRDITARVNREANITGITRRQVSNRIYNELGGSSFIFTSRDGSAWNGKTYTDMLGRTMLNNNARTAYLDGCAERGSDLVRISVSGNPCPKCAVWENRILSISGTNPNYPSLQEATAAGLFHPNCTHRMVAVPAGTAKRRYTADGRPLDGVNSPGKEEKNDADAWSSYRKGQHEKSARKAVDWKLANRVDKHYEEMSEKDRATLERYTNDDELKLNQALRGYKPMPKELQEEAYDLNRILEAFPKYQGEVWRGLSFGTDEERDAFIGRLFVNPDDISGFLSTTVDMKSALLYQKKYGKPSKVMLHCEKSSRGAYVGHKSEKPSDKEALMPSYVKFRPISLAPYEKDGILIIDVEEYMP